MSVGECVSYCDMRFCVCSSSKTNEDIKMKFYYILIYFILSLRAYYILDEIETKVRGYGLINLNPLSDLDQRIATL